MMLQLEVNTLDFVLEKIIVLYALDWEVKPC